jgi:hypothetical protein
LWFWDDHPSRNARDPRVIGAIEPRHGSECLDLGEKEKIRTNLTA